MGPLARATTTPLADAARPGSAPRLQAHAHQIATRVSRMHCAGATPPWCRLAALLSIAMPDSRPSSLPAAAPARWLAYLALASSMALVGSYVALSKPLVAAFPVFLLAWLRFGLGGVVMLHWLPAPAGATPLSPRTRWLVFLESFFGNFLFSLCMLYGMRLTDAVSAGVIMASTPTVVALMSRVVLGERVPTRVWVAAFCGALGMALLALGKAPAQAVALDTAAQHAQWLGRLLVFGAVLCESAYAVISKLLSAAISPKRASALINAWGFALVTPAGFYAALGFDFSGVTPLAWGLLLYYAMAASVGTVWLWMTGLRTVASAQAGVFTAMLPVSAALVGVLLLGETLGALQLLALGIALLGVLLATLPRRRGERAQG